MQYDPRLENIKTREEAKNFFRGNRGTVIGQLLLMELIMFALIFATTLLIIATGGEQLMNASKYGNMQIEASTSGLVSVLPMLISLISIPLMMGLEASMIGICRGQKVGVGGLFSRMNIFFKAIGLNLWVGLKIFLWALLGILAMAGCTVIGSLIGNEVVMSILVVVGIVAMFAIIIPPAYSYSLATYIMADDPTMGVFDSVRLSTGMMKGHRWQCFKLCIPYFLKYAGCAFGGLFAAGLLTTMLGENPVGIIIAVCVPMVMMLVGLYLMLPCILAYAQFYLKRAKREPAQSGLYNAGQY